MWLPKSPDLNPCDIFLGSYLKSKVYNPLTKDLDELKANIQREIKKIKQPTFKKYNFEFFRKVRFSY
jgi:hypothetical protein